MTHILLTKKNLDLVHEESLISDSRYNPESCIWGIRCVDDGDMTHIRVDTRAPDVNWLVEHVMTPVWKNRQLWITKRTRDHRVGPKEMLFEWKEEDKPDGTLSLYMVVGAFLSYNVVFRTGKDKSAFLTLYGQKYEKQFDKIFAKPL